MPARLTTAMLKREFPVTDDSLDAPDGSIVDGYERRGERWVPHGCSRKGCENTLTMYIGGGLKVCSLHATALGLVWDPDRQCSL